MIEHVPEVLRLLVVGLFVIVSVFTFVYVPFLMYRDVKADREAIGVDRIVAEWNMLTMCDNPRYASTHDMPPKPQPMPSTEYRG